MLLIPIYRCEFKKKNTSHFRIKKTRVTFICINNHITIDIKRVESKIIIDAAMSN